jgi:hypothetical protein
MKTTILALFIISIAFSTANDSKFDEGFEGQYDDEQGIWILLLLFSLQILLFSM